MVRGESSRLSAKPYGRRYRSVHVNDRGFPTVRFGDPSYQRKSDSRTLSRSTDEFVESAGEDFRIGIGSGIRNLESFPMEIHYDFRIFRRMDERVGNQIPKKRSEEFRIGFDGLGSGFVNENLETFGMTGFLKRFREYVGKVRIHHVRKRSRSGKEKKIVDRVAHRSDFGNRGIDPFGRFVLYGDSELEVAFGDRERRFELVGNMSGIRAFPFGKLLDGADNLSRERERNEEQRDRESKHSEEKGEKYRRSGSYEKIFLFVEDEATVFRYVHGIENVFLITYRFRDRFADGEIPNRVGRKFGGFRFKRTHHGNGSVLVRDSEIADALRKEFAFLEPRFEIRSLGVHDRLREISFSRGHGIQTMFEKILDSLFVDHPSERSGNGDNGEKRGEDGGSDFRRQPVFGPLEKFFEVHGYSITYPTFRMVLITSFPSFFLREETCASSVTESNQSDSSVSPQTASRISPLFFGIHLFLERNSKTHHSFAGKS